MRYIIFLFILLLSQNISTPLIPIWNLDNSAIKLLQSDSNDVVIYEKTSDFNVKLYKRLTRSSNTISEQNYINFNNNNDIPTDWEDIESFNHLMANSNSKAYTICPKGSHYLYKYDNRQFYPIKPADFDENSQWELICYRQTNKDFMFQGFLNLENNNNFYGLYYYDQFSGSWQSEKIQNAMYDFLWDTEQLSGKLEHNMYALVLIESKLYFENILITIRTDDKMFYINPQKDNFKTYLDEKSLYTRAYFDHDSNIFYWMSANKIDDFSSGYSTEAINIKIAELEAKVKSNSDSPFKFIGSYKIKQLDLIRNTRFVYYEIENNENQNECYYGIIDITLNAIVFNTNTKFRKFKPLNKYSMIGFTDTNVYQICAIKNGDQCVDKCSSGSLILDPINGNHCGNDECSLKLIPEGICISSCNTSIFTLNKDESQCGFCKDIYPDTKPYKLFGEEGCLSESEKTHRYLLYPQFLILDDCPANCKECENFDNCTSCIKGYKLSEGQCVQEEEKEEEEKEEEEEEKEKEEEEEEEEWSHEDNTNNKTDTDYPKDKAKYMLWIFIILIFIILLILSLCICKRNCARNKSDGEIINNINTELREDNNIME